MNAIRGVQQAPKDHAGADIRPDSNGQERDADDAQVKGDPPDQGKRQERDADDAQVKGDPQAPDPKAQGDPQDPQAKYPQAQDHQAQAHADPQEDPPRAVTVVHHARARLFLTQILTLVKHFVCAPPIDTQGGSGQSCGQDRPKRRLGRILLAQAPPGGA